MKIAVTVIILLQSHFGFSQNYDFYMGLFYTYYDDDNTEKALEVAIKGTQKFPDSIVFWARGGELYARSDKHRIAITFFNKAFELGETIPQLYLLRAISYQNLDSLDKAAEDYGHLEKIGQLDETVRTNFGHLEFLRKNYNHAIELIKPVFGNSFGFPWKDYALIHAYYRIEECDSVIHYASKMIEKDSSQINAYAIRAECYRRTDRSFEACEDFLVVFAAGNFEYKGHFDKNDCFDILNMSDPQSPYSYPPPPPLVAPIKVDD
ncbi:MAG: tetratricopeptide repeat protein [Fluviicola sp.]